MEKILLKEIKRISELMSIENKVINESLGNPLVWEDFLKLIIKSGDDKAGRQIINTIRTDQRITKKTDDILTALKNADGSSIDEFESIFGKNIGDYLLGNTRIQNLLFDNYKKTSDYISKEKQLLDVLKNRNITTTDEFVDALNKIKTKGKKDKSLNIGMEFLINDLLSNPVTNLNKILGETGQLDAVYNRLKMMAKKEKKSIPSLEDIETNLRPIITLPETSQIKILENLVGSLDLNTQTKLLNIIKSIPDYSFEKIGDLSKFIGKSKNKSILIWGSVVSILVILGYNSEKVYRAVLSLQTSITSTEKCFMNKYGKMFNNLDYKPKQILITNFSCDNTTDGAPSDIRIKNFTVTDNFLKIMFNNNSSKTFNINTGDEHDSGTGDTYTNDPEGFKKWCTDNTISGCNYDSEHKEYYDMQNIVYIYDEKYKTWEKE